MRWMKMCFGVMVPRLGVTGYFGMASYMVSDPLFESKDEAEVEAERRTAIARERIGAEVPACYVKTFALVPKQENQEEQG